MNHWLSITNEFLTWCSEWMPKTDSVKKWKFFFFWKLLCLITFWNHFSKIFLMKMWGEKSQKFWHFRIDLFVKCMLWQKNRDESNKNFKNYKMKKISPRPWTFTEILWNAICFQNKFKFWWHFISINMLHFIFFDQISFFYLPLLRLFHLLSSHSKQNFHISTKIFRMCLSINISFFLISIIKVQFFKIMQFSFFIMIQIKIKIRHFSRINIFKNQINFIQIHEFRNQNQFFTIIIRFSHFSIWIHLNEKFLVISIRINMSKILFFLFMNRGLFASFFRAETAFWNDSNRGRDNFSVIKKSAEKKQNEIFKRSFFFFRLLMSCQIELNFSILTWTILKNGCEAWNYFASIVEN